MVQALDLRKFVRCQSSATALQDQARSEIWQLSCFDLDGLASGLGGAVRVYRALRLAASLFGCHSSARCSSMSCRRSEEAVELGSGCCPFRSLLRGYQWQWEGAGLAGLTFLLYSQSAPRTLYDKVCTEGSVAERAKDAPH